MKKKQFSARINKSNLSISYLYGKTQNLQVDSHSEGPQPLNGPAGLWLGQEAVVFGVVRRDIEDIAFGQNIAAETLCVLFELCNSAREVGNLLNEG